MPTASRSRTFAVAQSELWELIADPDHQPRWWPGVERMESVGDDGFTQVLKTRRGTPIRADFLVAVREPPWMTVWEQQLPGTPFARVLSESVIQVNLEPAGEGTAVTIAHRLKPRGYSRTGGFLLGRDTAKQLDRLLDGIAALY
jgi:carbon monoxide dehydrogenase subunit G